MKGLLLPVWDGNVPLDKSDVPNEATIEFDGSVELDVITTAAEPTMVHDVVVETLINEEGKFDICAP